MAERLCEHKPCGCAPAPGQRYCDPVCRLADRERENRPPAAEEQEHRCRCGHLECHPDAAGKLSSDDATAP